MGLKQLVLAAARGEWVAVFRAEVLARGIRAGVQEPESCDDGLFKVVGDKVFEAAERAVVFAGGTECRAGEDGMRRAAVFKAETSGHAAEILGGS